MKKDFENEISQWLIEYNLKQFEAEDTENFGEAIFIRDVIIDFIDVNAKILAAVTDKKSEQIKQILINESNLIFNTIKNNKQNLNHL
jgi:hypothetical protein